MHLARTKLPALFLALASLLFSPAASADGWRLTGSGVRVKTVAFAEFQIYDIYHYVNGAVAEKSRQSVIDADVSKKVVWTMRRDVKRATMEKTLRSAFALNGYTNAGKIERFVAPFGDLKERQKVTFTYDTDSKATTLAVEGGGAVTIAGLDFMKAVWSMWFGRSDQPSLGDQLIARLP